MKNIAKGVIIKMYFVYHQKENIIALINIFCEIFIVIKKLSSHKIYKANEKLIMDSSFRLNS